LCALPSKRIRLFFEKEIYICEKYSFKNNSCLSRRRVFAYKEMCIKKKETRLRAQKKENASLCVRLQCVAACCSVLQCVAACWSVLQSVVVCCSLLQLYKEEDSHLCVCSCSVLHCATACCSVLQCVALIYVVVCCSAALQSYKDVDLRAHAHTHVHQRTRAHTHTLDDKGTQTKIVMRACV